MRLTIVGSGTAAPEPDRVCSSYHVAVNGVRLLLDVGPGAVHHMARFGIDWKRLSHVALTHFHNDHTGDLPTLLFALRWGMLPPRYQPLHLAGPPGTRDLITRMGAAFGSHVDMPDFPVHVHEMEDGDTLELHDGARLRALRTRHTDASLAFRVEAPDATLAYTGDTGPDPDLAAFVAGADTLVAECSLPDDEAQDGHMTPSRLAHLAHAAQPGRLVVVHVYPQLAGVDLAVALRDRGWAGETVRAHDGMKLNVGSAPGLLDDSGVSG
ncbi:MAG TPA: ribonuclease Z [Longimicrobiales bacterium]|nr:ribonuclease Z [Longimicrobiales bacterium]